MVALGCTSVRTNYALRAHLLYGCVMTKVTARRSNRVAIRLKEEEMQTLRRLMRNTGLGKSGVIRLAMTELADKRLPKN